MTHLKLSFLLRLYIYKDFLSFIEKSVKYKYNVYKNAKTHNIQNIYMKHDSYTHLDSYTHQNNMRIEKFQNETVDINNLYIKNLKIGH